VVYQTAIPASQTPALRASHSQDSLCSVGVVSLAIFKQSVAIFHLSDEHVDHKYSKDLNSKTQQLDKHDCAVYGTIMPHSIITNAVS